MPIYSLQADSETLGAEGFVDVASGPAVTLLRITEHGHERVSFGTLERVEELAD